jgi:hypothetical protein
MRVFFYLVPRETASKVDLFTGENGEPLNKTKVGLKTGNVYRPLVSATTGKLKTGLDVMVDNPYKTEEKDTIKPGFEPYIYGKEKIKLQYLLEYKHGVRPNYYSDDAPVKEVAGKDDTEKTPFFQTEKFKVVITDKGLMLDTDKHLDELTYYFLKSSTRCAPNLASANPNLHEYYIGQENESEEKLFNKVQLVDKAVSILVNPDFSDEFKVKIAKVLKLAKKETTGVKAHMLLRSYITENVKDQKERVVYFLDITESLKTPEGKEKLEAKALLEDLINYRVISSTGDIYKWKNRDITIGTNKTAAVEFLLNPLKQDEVLELERELREKTR